MKRPRFISSSPFQGLTALTKRRVLTALGALLVLSIAASALVGVRGRAAGGRFVWSSVLSRVFGSRTGTSLIPPAPVPAVGCVWTGATSTDWAIAGNWTTCLVGPTPQSGDTVSIGAATNQPTISSAVGSVGAIAIGTGGTLTVATGGSVTSTASMSFTGSGGALVITGGSMTVGTGSGTSIPITNSGTLNVQGGTLNIAGRLSSTTGGVTVSSGALNLCTVGQSSANASFDMGVSTNLAISGGTITLQNANGGAGGDLAIASGSGTKSITGGTFQIGNASTPAAQ